jgi:aromatic-L-amino-acid decarboxylase
MTDEEAVADHNRALLQRVNASGKVFLTHTVLRGRFALRLAIGQRTTEERHVREVMEELKSKVEHLLL